MNQADNSNYSTQKISPQLVAQIIDALKNKAWGSIEIYIENHTVTQITERTITKVAKANGPKITTPSKNGHQNATGLIPAGIPGRDQP